MRTAKFTCEAVALSVLGEPTKRAGAELLWHCPNHEDQHESLSINSKKDVFLCAPCNAGGTAWQFAAFLARLDPGDKPSVTAWLKGRGLLNGRQTAKAANGRRQCVAEYVYRDATGNSVARKLRFEPGRDGRKKEFSWQRWDGGAWVDGLGSEKMPLYRLPEIQNEPFVILTEGEKDADAGAKLELATTTSGGVNSFRDDHAHMLRGKDVVIVADADGAGRNHAQKVARLLLGKAESLKLLELPGAKDLSEWVESGGTHELLLDLIENTPGLQPRQIDGSTVLDRVFAYIRRFVSLSGSQARVAALWVVHTYGFAAAVATPYLAITSVEKQSGKTRLLEVFETLIANAWLTGRVTAAVLIRKIDAEQPTLLLDESDAAFGGDKEYAEALRGVLNTGHRKGGKASCCVGQGANIGFRDFSTFCPKAIAGIGKLPDTVADRAIPLRLRRAAPGEIVERFRRRDVDAEAAILREQIEEWYMSIAAELPGARPVLPDALTDRQQDGAEPLLAIADAAGREWPEAARRALIELCAEAQALDISIGKLLLSDILQIFEAAGVDRLSSAELVAALLDVETSPWSEWSRGKPLTPSRLARLLRGYLISPHSIRIAEKTPKGYEREDFRDAFLRYLRIMDAFGPQSATAQKSNTDAGSGGFSKRNMELGVAGREHEIPNENAACGGVAVSQSAAAKCDAGMEEDL
jgi:hypothetical protein